MPESLREFAAGGRWYQEDPPLKPMSGGDFEKWRAEWERDRASKAAWAALIGSTSGGGSGGDPRAGEEEAEEAEEDAAFLRTGRNTGSARRNGSSVSNFSIRGEILALYGAEEYGTVRHALRDYV
jgi:hypothetical protein